MGTFLRHSVVRSCQLRYGICVATTADAPICLCAMCSAKMNNSWCKLVTKIKTSYVVVLAGSGR